ncbi:MAG: nucleotide sugar dehydrogenase, partial [Thermoplasmata archaeon]|nr:nucleotide sugar dehydrogenase [Thermoplasmata archaeon]
VVGGINEHSLKRAVEFYQSFLIGTIHPISGIREAEATKVLENSQRNVNIAFMNEMARMFEKMGLDSHEIIQGASTKFNFVNVRPGPGVGGHCIPVDPYYLIYKSLENDFVPRLLVTACEINDSMPIHIAKLIRRKLRDVGKELSDSKVAILGLAYKANIGDIRESPAGPVISELRSHHPDIAVHDPFAGDREIEDQFGLSNQDLVGCLKNADCVVLLTDHDVFRQLSLEDIALHLNNRAVFVDTRGLFDPDEVNGLGIEYCRLGDGRNDGN